MCDQAGKASQEARPQKRLSDLIARETGVLFNEHVLRLFILGHWSKVTVLAHKIHDEGEAA